MAQQYDNTNRGSIWKNDKRESDKHPTHTGSINIDGKEYWLNGWVRAKDANEKAPAMSFSVRAKDGGNGTTQRQDSKSNAQNDGTGFDDMADDIPFINIYRGKRAYCI